MILPMAGILGGLLALVGIILLLVVALQRRAMFLVSALSADTRNNQGRTSAEERPRFSLDLAATPTGKATLRETLDCLLDSLVRVPGIDCGSVYVVREADQGLELVAHRGFSESFAGQNRCIEAGSPRAKRLMSGATLTGDFVDVMRTECNSDIIMEGVRSVAVVPVKHEGRVIAALKMGSHIDSSIPAQAVKAIETAASQIGGIIARKRAEPAS